jgi:hypothetical protein
MWERESQPPVLVPFPFLFWEAAEGSEGSTEPQHLLEIGTITKKHLPSVDGVVNNDVLPLLATLLLGGGNWTHFLTIYH